MNPFAVAIMQPYFLPYAGYFRLFAATDLFVIYDCVQFPRRGWVHRNRLVDASGKERWLTLPLAKVPQRTLIRDLCFASDAIDIRYDHRNCSSRGRARIPQCAGGLTPLRSRRVRAGRHRAAISVRLFGFERIDPGAYPGGRAALSRPGHQGFRQGPRAAWAGTRAQFSALMAATAPRNALTWLFKFIV